MSSDLTSKDIARIHEDYGFEEIIYQAGLSYEMVLTILEEAGYVDLSVYLTED